MVQIDAHKTDTLDDIAGWFNAITDIGLVDDNVTDNSPALQAWVDDFPVGAPRSGGVVVFPTTQTGQAGQGGQYLFETPVVLPPIGVRFVGIGSMGWADQRYMTSIHGGAGCDGDDIFTVDGDVGSGSYFQGPTFEHLAFIPHDPATHTNMGGLKLSRVVRCGVRNCLFVFLNTGLTTEENGVDNAWHDFQYMIFNDCKTGWNCISANSIDAFGIQTISCGVGVDLQTVSNDITIHGLKINAPVATGTYFTGGAKIGLHMQGYACVVNQPKIELNPGTGRVGIQISDSTAIPGTTGTGNIVNDLTIVGSGAGGATETGVLIDSGCDDNKTSVAWQSDFSGTGVVYNDLGKRNRINGGYAGLQADRPSAVKLNKGSIWFATNTGAAQYSDGTQWLTLPGSTRAIYKTTAQTVNNSVTLVDDNAFQIVFTGDSTTAYHLEVYLLVVSVNSTMDFKAAWTSAICAGRWGIKATAASTLPSFGPVTTATTPVTLAPLATEIAVGTITDTGADVLGMAFDAIVSDNGTSGTLHFRWAQNTASGADLTVSAGSYMRITKIH